MNSRLAERGHRKELILRKKSLHQVVELSCFLISNKHVKADLFVKNLQMFGILPVDSFLNISLLA